MNDRLDTRQFERVTIAVAATMATHAGHLPLWFSLPLALALALRAWTRRRGMTAPSVWIRVPLTALLLGGNRLGLAHIGDSRAYLLRDGELTQITDDHTLVQRYVDEGQLDEADVPLHPQRSVILRVLNGRPDDEADLSIREARAGDRYLLCSDGLSGVVSKDTICEALRVPDPQEAVDALVNLALRGGAPDNVTVIALEWETPDTFESTHGISTDTISDGVFASTIQAGVLDTLVDDLDDAAIERSIAEINEAIRRSAAKKA